MVLKYILLLLLKKTLPQHGYFWGTFNIEGQRLSWGYIFPPWVDALDCISSSKLCAADPLYSLGVLCTALTLLLLPGLLAVCKEGLVSALIARNIEQSCRSTQTLGITTNIMFYV